MPESEKVHARGMDLFSFVHLEGLKTMRALLIAAVLFFSVFGGGLVYFAISGTGHEYDLKLVLPIDTRKMPKLGPPPEIVSQIPDDTANPIVDGRAEAGIPPQPAGRPVRFPDRDGTASEAPSRR
jgi:hypothetical protein